MRLGLNAQSGLFLGQKHLEVAPQQLELSKGIFKLRHNTKERLDQKLELKKISAVEPLKFNYAN
jgi:hypothetical protein